MAGSGVGLFLVGEYLGVKREAGRPRANAEGNWPDRFKVGVRVGPDIFDVEYRTLDAAGAAVGRTEKGSQITVEVRARAAKGYVFWMGAAEAPSAGDYE